VQLVVQFYHGMVAIGFALILVAGLGFFTSGKGRCSRNAGCSGMLVLSVLGPQLANQLGWFAAEVGRQPWIVQSLMRTSEGCPPCQGRGRPRLVGSVTFIYLLLFAVFVYLFERQDSTRPGRCGPDAQRKTGAAAERLKRKHPKLECRIRNPQTRNPKTRNPKQAQMFQSQNPKRLAKADTAMV